MCPSDSLSLSHHSSNEVFIGVEIFVLACSITNDVIEVQLVSEEATDASKALHKLERLTALVSDQLNDETVLLVVHQQPVGKTFLTLDLQLNTGLRILEMPRVLLLHLIQVLNLDLLFVRHLNLEALHLNLLEQDHLF